MKSIRIKILEQVLKWMAVVVLKKYQPQIVGITGSVGKTSTKEAIFLVLKEKFRVRQNEKNYNNEIGLPLTILGAQTGGRSPLGWLLVLIQWLRLLIFKCEYPEILVLEMGVDRPGDMRYLTSFIQPQVGVITNIFSSHIEFFKTRENIAKEKGLLVRALSAEGTAILSADEELVAKLAEKVTAKVLTFGFSEDAAVRAQNPTYHYTEQNQPAGLSFKLEYAGTNLPVRLKNVLAPHQIQVALSAAAVGLVFKLNLVEIAQALENFHSPAGRLNLLAGIKGTTLIDDTYNASPASMEAALKLLAELKGKRKLAVLGDMLELGEETEIAHRQIGEMAAAAKLNTVILVGDRMTQAYSALKEKGFGERRVFHFDDPESAGLKLQEIMQPEDLVLIKGSQGMRMEKVVEEVLADPVAVEKLLCRQNPTWRKKPFVKP